MKTDVSTTPQLAVKDLPPKKRQNLERTRAWLEDRRQNLRDRIAEYADAAEDLVTVLSRIVELEPQAAQREAASELATLNIQRSNLEPRHGNLKAALAGEIKIIARQIGAVRENDIRPAVAGPLNEALQNIVRSAIAPFFTEDDLPHQVKHFAGQTVQGRRIDWYLVNRRTPSVRDVGDAESELTNTIDEITRILNGEPVMDFNAA